MFKKLAFVCNDAVGEEQAAPGLAVVPVQSATAIAQIKAQFNNKIDMVDYKFHFKKDDLGNKRQTVELKLPVPSIEGIVAILESTDEVSGPKGRELLLAAVADIISSQARNILNDEANQAMNAASFPLDQVTFEAIALLPDAEKRCRGIAKEVWDEFVKDYISIMPAITGKTIEAVSFAAKLLLGKYNSIKTNKPVIAKLKEQLAIYTNNSPQAETFSECVKFLDEKADSLMKLDESAMLANL